MNSLHACAHLNLAAWLSALLFSVIGNLSQASEAPAQLAKTPQAYGIEVIVRTGENFQTENDVWQFVEAAVQHNLTAINLLVKQDEDGAIGSGTTFYSSTIAPSAPGYERFDVLQTLLNATQNTAIQVIAWMPQFHDQVAAKRHRDWPMLAVQHGQVQPYTGSRQKEYFVNPLHPDVQAYELSLIKEVTSKYKVQGVMLDWIRFDNYNMDLSDWTRQQFQKLHQTDPLTLDFSTPGAALSQWNEYRTLGVAKYVRQVRADVPASMRLGVYILPPEFLEVAQDASKFNSVVQSLGPMCYFNDWQFPIEWFWSSCLSSTVANAGKAEIVPAMDSKLTDAQYAQIFTRMRADYPQIKTISWFYHGKWTPELMARIAQLSQLSYK